MKDNTPKDTRGLTGPATGRCMKCGESKPCYTGDFLVIKSTSESSVTGNSVQQTTTTRTDYSFEGRRTCSVCGECIEKGMKKPGCRMFVILFIGFFVGAVASMIASAGNDKPGLGIFLLVAITAGSYFLARSLNKKEAENRSVIANMASVLSSMDTSIDYVPAEKSLYTDADDFYAKNKHILMIESVAKQIYEKLF